MNDTNNHYSSKREKYLLKKQRKEQERSQRERKKKTQKTISVALTSLVVILVVGGAIWGLNNYFSNRENKEVSQGEQGEPKIEISPLEYNAGVVSMTDNRFLKHTYEIKNNGDGDLKIDRIWTSCMCTTAILKVGDKTSPEFGMHNNPLFWSQNIAPGETGHLEVTFDTGYHGPQGTGSAMREIYISNNDPQDGRAKVRLLAEVVP